MAVRESQKNASVKWHRENMGTLACKVKREQAEEFKAFCQLQGTSANTVLKSFVLSCIGSGNIVPNAVGVSENELIPPDTIEAARSAAEQSGETVAAFISRAINTQAQRDKLTSKLGQR